MPDVYRGYLLDSYADPPLLETLPDAWLYFNAQSLLGGALLG